MELACTYAAQLDKPFTMTSLGEFSSLVSSVKAQTGKEVEAVLLGEEEMEEIKKHTCQYRHVKDGDGVVQFQGVRIIEVPHKNYFRMVTRVDFENAKALIDRFDIDADLLKVLIVMKEAEDRHVGSDCAVW